jgi:hypothetical protein
MYKYFNLQKHKKVTEKDSGGWHSILIKSLMCESDECMLYEVDDIHQTKPH